MAEKVFLTGATGFLGTYLAAGLIKRPNTELYVLVRGEDEKAASYRLRRAWQDEKELCEQIGKKIICVPGDFTEKGLKISCEQRKTLLDTVTMVIHAGAEISFGKSRRELFTTNFIGTKNIIAFAKKIKSLDRFVYVSTAYVAGQKSGLITEEEPVGDRFSSFYEKTKAKAEMLVRDSGLPFSICRPGMIVGDSKTGRVKNFNTIYYVLKLLLLDKVKVLPIKGESKLNLVPVDYVADSIIKISFSKGALGKTFHLTCPDNMAPTAKELTIHVNRWAKENLAVDLTDPAYTPMPFVKQIGIDYNRKVKNVKKGSINNILILLPYFFANHEFDRTNTIDICGTYGIRWQDYIDLLLGYAVRKNFMRQTGQTVFEQALVRRESKRYTINYFDITSDGINKVSGHSVNERIEEVREALFAWGIRKGDRVALTGINSVDYLVLEQAIGLLGAVSVPIYYTTPAAEAEILLKKSGASYFFVGDERMFAQLEQISTEAKTVLFSVIKDRKLSGTLTWAEFLEKPHGEKSQETGSQVAEPQGAEGNLPGNPRGIDIDLPGDPQGIESQMVEPQVAIEEQYPEADDLATIRYTSGTTGEPKGVTFSFRQLAWMGEVLSNLVSWEDRNRPMRYLSFLPLSHVVEGILASYAPYYMLTDVEYYYLNDFGALVDSLPKVRPTVFFSVPRFYEKLWDQVMANPMGKAWFEAKEGAYKKVLGNLVKSAVLKKAGLDQCRQLIVGSAPVSETLLLNFRALGIEIHNAYGQTEAPLITINRLNDNIIPTIGTALPETEITTGEDGELIVKGPQVTLGYYNMKTDNIKDGVLYSGDLGVIHKNGHISLFGRKKDFIITAYGKNISIPKIEQKIKDIPDVSEAVLIGENRPYCTALIWMDKEGEGALAAAIEKMNEELSHPEQIRKFTLIHTPLSIQEGELTPNLKVKRNNVEAHYAKEIEEMYK